MFSTGASAFDWAAAERRERRREPLVLAGLAAFFGGLVLLTGRFGFWTGRAGVLAVAVYLALVGVGVAASRLRPLRRRQAGNRRVQIALREHVDPGPELRDRVDRQARYLAELGWVPWCMPLVLLTWVGSGQWHRPWLAVPGAVLVVAVAAAWFRWWRVQQRAARRWLADPPGPARAVPPLTGARSWLSGRRFAALAAVLVVAGFLTGLVAAVVGRA